MQSRWSQLKRWLGGKPLVHCWEDGPRIEDMGSTCMRLDGHFGAHEFTPDGEVMVTFETTPLFRCRGLAEALRTSITALKYVRGFCDRPLTDDDHHAMAVWAEGCDGTVADYETLLKAWDKGQQAVREGDRGGFDCPRCGTRHYVGQCPNPRPDALRLRAMEGQQAVCRECHGRLWVGTSVADPKPCPSCTGGQGG